MFSEPLRELMQRFQVPVHGAVRLYLGESLDEVLASRTAQEAAEWQALAANDARRAVTELEGKKRRKIVRRIMWATKLAPFDIEQLLFHGIDTEGVLAERARIARERLGSRVREGIARLWRDERRALIEEMLARRELSATRVDPLLRSFIGNGLGRLWDAIPIGKIVDRCQRDLDETQDVAAAVAEHPAAIEALGQVRTAYALEADSIWNDARDRAALGRAKGIWGAYLTRVVPEWAKDHAGDAEHCEQLTERATKYVESAVSSRTPIEEFLRTALDPIESIPLGVEFELVLGQRISLALRKLLDSHTRAIVNAVARAAARKRQAQETKQASEDARARVLAAYGQHRTIRPEHFERRVSREDIADFLAERSVSDKWALIERLCERLASDELALRRFHGKFREALALGAYDVEQILGIAKTERVRWTKDGRLPVVYYEPVQKYGRTLQAPQYDALAVGALLPATLDAWREPS